jgi:hypothetical protein
MFCFLFPYEHARHRISTAEHDEAASATVTRNDDREIWRAGEFSCVMISCCAGAELQLWRRTPVESLILRELYPTKSDLFERARMLRAEYGSDQQSAS